MLNIEFQTMRIVSFENGISLLRFYAIKAAEEFSNKSSLLCKREYTVKILRKT